MRFDATIHNPDESGPTVRQSRIWPGTSQLLSNLRNIEIQQYHWIAFEQLPDADCRGQKAVHVQLTCRSALAMAEQITRAAGCWRNGLRR
jgi:hypothetical protein